jgi:hypothetical protein
MVAIISILLFDIKQRRQLDALNAIVVAIRAKLE